MNVNEVMIKGFDHHNLSQILYEVYEIGGPEEVKRFVRLHFPDWTWEHCLPCEEETPTWADVCSVCWTQREWA